MIGASTSDRWMAQTGKTMTTLTRPTRRELAGLLLLPLAPAAGRAQTVRAPDQHFFQLLLGDLRRELQSARQEGRVGALLIYEMEGCPFCVRFHKTVLREVAVQDWYRRHFAIYRIDIRGANPLVGFDGKEGTEAAFAAAQRIRATPTSVFYDLQGQETVRYAGAPRDAREFMQLGEFVVSGAWRQGGFDAWKARRS